MVNVISKTKNGKIFKCDKCNSIHLEFKNLNFNFSEEQFDTFADYIVALNGFEWEKKNKESYFNRKIFIAVNSSFNVVLHNYELLELKQLLSFMQDDDVAHQTVQMKNLKFTNYLN